MMVSKLIFMIHWENGTLDTARSADPVKDLQNFGCQSRTFSEALLKHCGCLPGTLLQEHAYQVCTATVYISFI